MQWKLVSNSCPLCRKKNPQDIFLAWVESTHVGEDGRTVITMTLLDVTEQEPVVMTKREDGSWIPVIVIH
jgi:hypothetical protein